mgnify:CR=1 FL=1
MPEISLFYGIKISMNWSEHNPPHFHAEYANYKASVLIEDGIISAGYLPKRQLKFVLAWAELHKDDVKSHATVFPITVKVFLNVSLFFKGSNTPQSPVKNGLMSTFLIEPSFT